MTIRIFGNFSRALELLARQREEAARVEAVDPADRLALEQALRRADMDERWANAGAEAPPPRRMGLPGGAASEPPQVRKLKP
jgi:hypothetical protein